MKRLQRFDFKSSRYQRPNQEWECGHADKCAACPNGPDASGNCRATTECKPRKDGDRWNCTRPDSMGGKCADGPLPDGTCCRAIPPCTPKRSVRARRKLTVLLTFGFTVGVILVCLGLPGRAKSKVFSPGPVIAQHASGDISCDRCHSAAELSSPGWLLAAFKPNSAHADSARCLSCHNLGAQPNRPHGLSDVELAALTRQIVASGHGSSPSASGLTDKDGNLSCATCHREHHGRDFDLKKIPDAGCQVCHTNQFAGFPSGHPDFSKYPYERRTRIVFDHNAHISNYFLTDANRGKAPEGCNSCHVIDSQSRLMLVRGFEQSCASCHSDNIARPGAAGVAFLRIPGIDPSFAKSNESKIGKWPLDADGPLTPFMRQLLSSDPKAGAALATLDKVDLLNIPAGKPEISAAVETLAWSVKDLVADLLVNGHETIKKRLGPSSESLSGSIPPESLQAFTRAEWWPDLLAEVAAHRAGVPLPAKAPAPVAPAAKPESKPAAPAKATDDIIGDDILAGDTKPASKPAAKPAATDDILGGDDILASAPKAPAKPAAASGDILGDDILGGDTPAAPVVAKKAPALPSPAAPEKWTRDGGWYASGADYSLRYRPTGHADAFLKAWQDYAAARATTPVLRSELTGLAEAGSCLKCHSVDASANGAVAVNWKSATTDSHLHKFTKFSHGTHFSLLTENGCQTCHKLNEGAAYKTAYKDNVDPAVFESNFRKMNMADCARCHTEKEAGNSCQLCHNYHIGQFAPTTTSGFAKTKPAVTQ